MKLLTILFLATLSFCSVSGGRSVIFPKQNYASYVELFPQQTMALKAITLCMRFGSALPLKETILFEYRTKERDELSIWRMKDGRYGVYLGDKSAHFRLPKMTSLLSHMCFIWDSNTGLAFFYWSGQRSMMTNLQRGYKLKAGGRVILGQDADSLLGHFDWHQSFAGEITDVNVWDHVISQHRVNALANNVAFERGNVINWDTVKLQAKGKYAMVVDNSLAGAPSKAQVRTSTVKLIKYYKKIIK